MFAELQRITNNDGVLAAFTTDGITARAAIPQKRDTDLWSEEFESAARLLNLTRQIGGPAKLRVIFTETNRSLMLESEQQLVLGVLIVKGHPVGKSLRRTMRRTLKRLLVPSTLSSDGLPPIVHPPP